MPSTYTLNNGIELIGTGEQSGTWGDTTNTNLGLLDAALDGQVTVALASAGSSGSPNSLPITDGTASNGRNRMVVFSDSGDLGATAYVQLTPNDAEKIIYIRNSLSGSRSVILFQGTYNASNDYEVPAGTTAIVYFDGAGAGAVAANVFNNAYFDGLRLGSVSVTAILDEDNMASDSATALATQQSIKAYVDSQVGTVDTLAEILAIGNTTGATDIAVDSAQKVQFRDAAIYINSSVDGQLDIVADTEIQIAATTVDLNGNLDVSGTLGVTGVLTATSLDISGDIDVDGTTNLDVVDIDGAVDMASTLLVTGVLTTTAATVSNGGGQFNGAINVGVDDTGYDVKFFGATTGKSLLWDESADSLIVTGTTTLVGTTNLDAVDIDGATQIDATVTVGVDDTGYDVKFFGATAGAYMLWDESADDLILGGAAGLSVNSTALVTGVLTTTAATVSNGGGQFNGAINVGVDDTGYDVKFFGATAGKYMLWDESADTLEVSGTVVAAAGTALLPSITTTGDLNTGMWFPAADTIAFSEGGVEALRINSSGRVGIGTSSPVYNFVVSAAGASGIEFGPAYSGTANLVQHYSRSGAVYVDAVNVAAQHRFDISGTERMRIDSLGGLITKPAAGGHAVFNDTDVDADFRVASDTNTHALFVQGSDGNVGIGLTPTEQLHVGGRANAVLELQSSTTTGTGRVNFNDGANSGQILYSHTANTMDFYSGGSYAMRLTSTGITAPQGIIFGDAGGSGTPTSNTLDDYEEGTWTPTITLNSGTATTYSTLAGNYTKTGRMVVVLGHIIPSDGTLGSTNGYVRMTGLPFTVPASGVEQGVGSGLNASYLDSGVAGTCAYGTTVDVAFTSASASANSFRFVVTYFV
jgi:cytoskeletal protein CcmA (bactofilin family)